MNNLKKIKLPITNIEITLKYITLENHKKLRKMYDVKKNEIEQSEIINDFLKKHVINIPEEFDWNFIDRNYLLFHLYKFSNDGVNLFGFERCPHCGDKVYSTHFLTNYDIPSELKKNSFYTFVVGDDIIKIRTPEGDKIGNIYNWISSIENLNTNTKIEELETIKEYINTGIKLSNGNQIVNILRDKLKKCMDIGGFNFSKNKSCMNCKKEIKNTKVSYRLIFNCYLEI